MNDPVKAAFNKLFGDMYLSESDVAFKIFEYGYQAGQDQLTDTNWIGLSDEQKQQYSQWAHIDVIEDIEAALRDKNTNVR